MAVIIAKYVEQVDLAGFYFGLLHNQVSITQPSGSVRALEQSPSVLIGGIYTYAPDVSVPAQQELDGVFMGGWFNDYYNRVLITPSFIALKTLASETTENVYIWNAYLDASKTMTSVVSAGADGVSFAGLVPPVTFQPNEEKQYSVTAEMAGPGVIDAIFGFVFSLETPELRITGQRLVIWPFIPGKGIEETLEWFTDVLQTYEGEQRIALREAPRQILKYSYLLNEQDFSLAKAIAIKWGGNLYGMPVWSELFRYGFIAEGTTTLSMDTTVYDYQVDGFVFIWGDNNNFVSREIISLTDSQIELKYPLEEFTKALVMPIKSSINKEGIKFNRSAVDFVNVSAGFTAVNDVVIESAGEGLGYPEYLGDEVVIDPQVVLSDMPETIVRGVDFFDNGSGPILMENQLNYPRNRKTLTMTSQTTLDRWNNKAWLYSRVGKQKRFWVISWNRDIVLTHDILTSELSIKCANIGYALYRTITDIAVINTDGTILFNRILSGGALGDGEALELNAAFAADIDMDDVERICFMSLVRLDSDAVVINHKPSGHASCKIPIKEIPA